MTLSLQHSGLNALTFRLADEIFAIEAECVCEILDPVPITRVPNAPDFVSGLINVRGTIVPLADLRVVFGMQRPPADQDTRIVVMECAMADETMMIGFLADKVFEVSEIPGAAIEAVPAVGMRWPPEFVRGIGKRDAGFVIIPNMQRILQLAEGPVATKVH